MLLSMEYAGCGMGESCLVGRGRAGRLLQPPGCPAGCGGLALHIQADQLPGRPAGCALYSGTVLLQESTSIISTCFASCPAQYLTLMIAHSRLALCHAVKSYAGAQRSSLHSCKVQAQGLGPETPHPLPVLL